MGIREHQKTGGQSGTHQALLKNYDAQHQTQAQNLQLHTYLASRVLTPCCSCTLNLTLESVLRALGFPDKRLELSPSRVMQLNDSCRGLIDQSNVVREGLLPPYLRSEGYMEPISTLPAHKCYCLNASTSSFRPSQYLGPYDLQLSFRYLLITMSNS